MCRNESQSEGKLRIILKNGLCFYMKKILLAFISVFLCFSYIFAEIEIANEEALKELSQENIDDLHIVNQGMMFLTGNGVKKDPLEAFRLFSLSADQGNQYAQANLGLMYTEGFKGIDINYEKAVYWFGKASEQGNAYAQASLGYLYENGYGVEVSFTEAYDLYKQSASQGNMLAHRNLGFVYEQGKGMPVDLQKAYMWFILAGAAGDKTSESKAYELKELLDRSQLKEAFEMADTCINSEYAECGYSVQAPKYKPLNFVCNYQYDEPLTLQIKDKTILIGSLDVKHELKILSRNDRSIEWTDNTYMKLPFNVDHELDLENQVMQFNLGSNQTKLDCIQVEESEIKEYEQDMESVVQEEGWSPRLPTLSFYLKMAEDKDHPKVLHQMNLRCESLLFTKIDAILKSFCPALEVTSAEFDIKECMGESNFSVWKEMTNDLLQHTDAHHQLNVDGGFLTDRQLNSQYSVIMDAYEKSFTKYLNKKENENCWGDTTGLLCWEEEELMCGKIREEESMQAWFDKVTSSSLKTEEKTNSNLLKSSMD